jgi:hypothetical protein
VEKNKSRDDVEMESSPVKQISPVKQESEEQLQLEQSEEAEAEMKMESGKLSPVD